MAKTSKKDEVQPIIVKKVKKAEHAHHGGAWKVAYADFVTAMMAFFLLLWLLNVSTDDALETISNYFDPTHAKISERTSGAGGLMGGLSMSPEGAMVTDVQPLIQPRPTGMTSQGAAPQTELSTFQRQQQQTLRQLEEELRKEEQKRFTEAKKELEKQVKENQELADLAKNLLVDITPEGLRIQIVDQEGKPMFPLGSAEMYDYTRKLMQVVAGVVTGMPNDISIRGHTDSYQYAPGAKYTNWELSADRANSSRRALLADGVPAKRLANIMGKADKEHLVAENPTDARNRRISIILLNETMKQAFTRGAFDGKLPEGMDELPEPEPQAEPGGAFQKTPGAVYFP